MPVFPLLLNILGSEQVLEIFHGGPGKSWKSPGFLSVKELEPCLVQVVEQNISMHHLTNVYAQTGLKVWGWTSFESIQLGIHILGVFIHFPSVWSCCC